MVLHEDYVQWWGRRRRRGTILFPPLSPPGSVCPRDQETGTETTLTFSADPRRPRPRPRGTSSGRRDVINHYGVPPSPSSKPSEDEKLFSISASGTPCRAPPPRPFLLFSRLGKTTTATIPRTELRQEPTAGRLAATANGDCYLRSMFHYCVLWKARSGGLHLLLTCCPWWRFWLGTWSLTTGF